MDTFHSHQCIIFFSVVVFLFSALNKYNTCDGHVLYRSIYELGKHFCRLALRNILFIRKMFVSYFINLSQCVRSVGVRWPLFFPLTSFTVFFIFIVSILSVIRIYLIAIIFIFFLETVVISQF